MLPPEVNRWISEEFSRLAEIVKDYDEHLELRWIPPELRTDPNDRKNPYAIVHSPPDKPAYVVMFASELDNPKDILEKLFNIDNKNGDVFKAMMAHNRAVKAFQLKEQMDELEEARDLTAFAIKNTKSRWQHNGITYDDEMRRVA